MRISKLSKVHNSFTVSNKKDEDYNIDIHLRNEDQVWFNVLLKQRKQSDLFTNFKRHQFNIGAYLIILLFITTYFAYGKGLTYVHFPSVLSTVSLVVGVVALALGWLLFIFYTFKKRFSKVKPYLSFLESLWLFFTTISVSLNIVVVGYNGHCPPHYDMLAHGFGCNYSSPHQMPEDMMIVSLMVPVFLSIIIKTVNCKAICFSFAMNVLCVFFTILYFDLRRSLPSFCVMVPLTMLLMYENCRQSLGMFLLTQNKQKLLDDNDRFAKETQANELRHMIGNVAHDLKTPLSAYVSGIELIMSILPDINSNLQPLPGCIEKMRDKLNEVGETIQNMRTVNEFMLMTINRCIDYTKSSQGLKLVPRMETVNFAEAINFPLNCMRNLQDTTVEVKLMTISPEIGSHIITDKQWLQENILCLLSNAVKYSTGGTATVSVSLLDSEQACRLSQVFGAERQSVSASVMSAQSGITPPMIRFDIEDTGIGIATSAMKALFAPFNQAQRLAGGTGLGLYSLARRVEALKGLYGVSRRRDGQSGSLFWFAIPYRPDDTMVAQPNMRASDSTGASAATTSDRNGFNLHGSSMEVIAERVAMNMLNSRSSDMTQGSTKDTILNILVVDDSPAILKMSSRMLRQLGHRVTTAVNGADAIEKIITELSVSNIDGDGQSSAGYFDVVLMDLQMPVMDGLEATSRIRDKEMERKDDMIVLNAKQSGRSSYSPVHSHLCVSHQIIIGVSACSDNETMEAAFAAGIDAFIAKPFTMQSFKETYNTVCQKRDITQQF